MPKTLLVADDSVVIQKLVGLSFANEEINLITTDNGDDAVKMVREKKPDLVLADVVMPGLSGYEVCQAIKQDPELGHIAVVLLTGTFEAFDEERAREVGADGHITKPFEAQVLVQRVNELLVQVASASGASATSNEAPPPIPTGEYSFFEESPAPSPAAEIPTAPASLDNDLLEFAESHEGSPTAQESPGTPAELAGDRTIVVAPVVAPQSPIEPPADALTTAPAGDPGLTVLADFDFDAGAPSAIPTPAQTTPDEPFMADDFSFADATPGDAATPSPILDDDLFGDASPAAGDAMPSNAFDFGSSNAAPPASEAVTSGEFSQTGDPRAISLPNDSGLPGFATAPQSLEPQDDLLEIEPLDDPAPELQVDLEPDTISAPADFVASTEAPAAAIPATPMATAPATDAVPQLPDLAPMIRERLHETLEKVAWEAFADISDTIVRQVLAKVESIAWDVIPQMAEAMIQEEIRRMKGEQE